MNSDLTIIIPTLNTTSYKNNQNEDMKIHYSLRHCLVSLQETTKEIPLVVVSNNGDAKPLPLEVNSRIKRINLWGQGQCKAVNAAVATTNTEWIMITNDDMVYPPGWLEKLWEGYSSDCFCPMLIEPQDGAPTFKKVFFGGAGGDFNKNGFLEYAKTHEGSGWRTGFNMPLVIRRDLWDLVGGYDINYDPWGSNSDSDLEYKIRLAGTQPMQNSDACVYHFSQTSGTFHPRNQAYWAKNFAYFEEKWGFPRTDTGIWEANFAIPYDKLKYKPSWMEVLE